MARPKTIRELLVSISVKADAKAMARVDKQLTKIKAGLGTLVSGTALVTAALIATTAVLFRTAQATATAGDEAAKAGRRLGLTAAEVQELGFAAEISGASIADVETGLRRLSKNARDAQRGLTTATDAFTDIGVAFEKSPGQLKEPLELLLDTSEAFKSLTNDTEKAALAQELFGRGGVKLLPLLVQGREGIEALREEARALGFVFDEDAAAAAERFIDSQTEMRKVLEGLRNTIGIALIPVFTDMIDSFVDWFKANREVIKQRLERTAERIADAFRTVGRVLRRVDRIVVERVGGWGRVFTLVATAVGVLVGLKGLTSLVTIIQAVIAVFGLAGTIIGGVGAGPLAVIAAVVAVLTAAFGLLFLAVDDLIVFFRGGDSVLGEFIKRFGEGEDASESLARIMKAMRGIGVELLQVLADIGTTLMDVFGPALEVVAPLLTEFLFGFATSKAKEILDFFEGLAILLEGIVTFLRLINKLEKATEFVPGQLVEAATRPLTADDLPGLARTALGGGIGVAAGDPGALGQFLGSVLPGGGGGGGTSTTTTTVGDLNVRIDARGADAEEVARIVEEKDAERRRQTADALRGGDV